MPDDFLKSYQKFGKLNLGIAKVRKYQMIFLSGVK